VNGSTGSKRVRLGYDEHAAAMHRLNGSRAEVDEDAMSSKEQQQKRTPRAGCCRDVLRAVLLRGGLGGQCTLQAVASRVGCDLDAAGVPPRLIGSSAQHLAKIGAFEVCSTTIIQYLYDGKIIAECISVDGSVDDVVQRFYASCVANNAKTYWCWTKKRRVVVQITETMTQTRMILAPRSSLT
jgi:hypothetical protein